MATNLQKLLDLVGSISAFYLILKWFIPVIQNLYAEYGAVVFIGIYFLAVWLKKSK